MISQKNGKSILTSKLSSNSMDHPVNVEDSSLTVVHSPGKVGGTFQLPRGAKLKVPESCMGKKETITCQVASPNNRWLTCPHHLHSYENVNSDIFIFKSSAKSFKKNILLLLPFKPVKHEFEEINVKGKWTDEAEWVNVGFLIKELNEAPCVELDISRLGTFVITTAPKTETLEVSKLGCLHQSRLMKHLTLRFPKKSVDQDIHCAVQIIPIGPDFIQSIREEFPQETADLLTVTEFIDVIASQQCTFRHPVTIKLPLPAGVELNVEGGGSAATSEGHPEIAVLYKTTIGWEIMTSNYKFTRTVVTVDVKELTRYCVVKCVPGRHKKMKDVVSLLEGRNNKEKGEICLFLSMKTKSWFALVEVVPDSIAATKISDRKAQGFTFVAKKQAPLTSKLQSGFNNNRMTTARRNVNQREATFEIYEGLTWLIDVDGDIKISLSSDLRENNQLRYFSRLAESYRTFFFEPLENESRSLEASINLIPVGIRDEVSRNKLTFTFEVAIEESTVLEYFSPETLIEEIKPKSQKEQAFEVEVNKVKEKSTAAVPALPTIRELPQTVMKRLTQIHKPIRVPDRESKVLSGKSLMTLARLVQEGLTLAVHLQLPDSTITGIGFDALSNNLTMSDVSYKILLYWKRKCKDKQTGAVTQLTTALREMDYPDIAAAILQCHEQKKEFTTDCLATTNVVENIALN